MIPRVSFRIFAGLVLLCIAGLQTMSAQSGLATLQGTVTDSTGALIPGARVNIRSQLMGTTLDVVANEAGIYTATDLPVGTYVVRITANTFASQTINHVLLTVGEFHQLNVTMSASTATTTVTVTESMNQVNPGETAVQGLIDGKQTRSLPLNGRDWTSLATLNPGVSQILTQFAGAATATTRLSRGLGGQMTIGGNRPQQNGYRLDGISINDYANGGPGSVSGNTLGTDAVQEFNVITSNAQAQYGRMSGGVINSITRSGTNTFHGSIYDFVRNNVFDTRNYFDPVTGTSSFRRNQFGGTVGGPVIRNHTFFFANYEGFRQAQGVAMSSTTLSPNAKNGLVTCTSGTGCVNGLKQLTIDPSVVPYLSLYPAPNGKITGNTGFYKFSTTQTTNEDFSTIHMDQNFSQYDSLRGTIVYDTASLDSADGTNTLYDESVSRRTTAALEETHIFSARLTNSFRIGFNRSAAAAPNQKAVLNPAINNPALGFYSGQTVGQIQVSSLTTLQGGSGSVGTNNYHFNAFQLYDDLVYVRGKHTLAFGTAIEYDQNNAIGGVLPNGEWNFGSVNNFLTNVPSFFEGRVPQTQALPHDLRQWTYAGYLQDSWKLRNNLTVNAGVRYEMATNTTDSGAGIGSLPTTTSPAAVAVKTFYTNNPTVKNFEPRVGVAWNPRGNGRTVLTVSSGLYDILPLNYTYQLQVISSAPAYKEGRVTYSGSSGKGLFPVSPFYSTTPKLRAIYTPPNPPRSYVIQNSVNLQQQMSQNTVLQIGYIGSHGVHQLFSTNDINNVPTLGKDPAGSYYWPDLTKVTGAARKALQLNQSIGTESDSFFGGSSIYHSLQASLSYASQRGFAGKASYTWSHSIDDSSSQVSGSSFSNAVSGLPAFDMSLNRANSDFDIRHVFSANALLPLPSPKSGGLLRPIVGGWTLSNVITYRTGIPFTPVIGGDPLGLLGSQPFAFPNRDVLTRNCTNGHTIAYVDTSCFSFPSTYNYAPGLNGPVLGTSRRNTLTGPNFFFWTLGVIKDQKVGERLDFQFQAQAFDLTNHTNFSNPASAQNQFFSVSGNRNGTAGYLTSTVTPGDTRQVQFALKVLF